MSDTDAILRDIELAVREGFEMARQGRLAMRREMAENAAKVLAGIQEVRRALGALAGKGRTP